MSKIWLHNINPNYSFHCYLQPEISCSIGTVLIPVWPSTQVKIQHRLINCFFVCKKMWNRTTKMFTILYMFFLRFYERNIQEISLGSEVMTLQQRIVAWGNVIFLKHFNLSNAETEPYRNFWLIPWLLMTWLLPSPGHQHPQYWLCRLGAFLFLIRKEFRYLCHPYDDKLLKI